MTALLLWSTEAALGLTCKEVREKGSEAAACCADANGSDQLWQGPVEKAEEVVRLLQEPSKGSVPDTLPVPRRTCAGTVSVCAVTVGAGTGGAQPWAA